MVYKKLRFSFNDDHDKIHHVQRNLIKETHYFCLSFPNYVSQTKRRHLMTYIPQMEYEVEERDTFGKPSIISYHEQDQPSIHKILDDKKLSKKSRLEREALIAKNQMRLEQLHTAPVQLERAQKYREERE